jgi:FlaG/FlaF family flagellin (archaellin)
MKHTRINNTEAVSPVIGVIADMVGVRVITLPHYDGGETYGRDKSLVLNYWFAPTVILAAVIAAFVFGMAGQITKTKVVAATVARPTANTVVVTYQGGQDSATLEQLDVTINDETMANINSTPSAILKVGKSGSYSVPTATAATRIHVVVTGVFSDSAEQVILDTFI